MSVELFLNTYSPPDRSIKGVVAREQQRHLGEGHPMSPVGVLASMFVEQGRSGLSDFSVDLCKRSRDSAGPDLDTLIAKKPKEFAAVLIGNSIKSVEDCLFGNLFDLNNYKSRINAGLVGTGISYDTKPCENVIEIIDNGKWREMIDSSKIDMTLSRFFREDRRRLLPKSLFGFIDKILLAHPELSGHFDYVLDHYKELAQVAIEDNVKV